MDVAAVEDQLIRLFDAPGVLWTALVVAFAVGAFHAVAPGHGKSITAAYLVAGDAQRRDAVLLGSAVAVMHTLSVGVLAVVWVTVSAASTLATDVVTGWMQVVAAVVVIGVGITLVWQRATGRGHHHHHHGPHHHAHGAIAGHEREHDHAGRGHDHGSAHAHGGTAVLVSAEGSRISAPTAVTRERATSRRMILALATAGGLLPSPSAFLILVSGMLTGRALYAVVLVAMFGLGMAVTLTGVGFATIRGARFLGAKEGAHPLLARLHAAMPVIGAVGVLLGGVVYLTAALRFVI